MWQAVNAEAHLVTFYLSVTLCLSVSLGLNVYQMRLRALQVKYQKDKRAISFEFVFVSEYYSRKVKADQHRDPGACPELLVLQSEPVPCTLRWQRLDTLPVSFPLSSSTYLFYSPSITFSTHSLSSLCLSFSLCPSVSASLSFCPVLTEVTLWLWQAQGTETQGK